MRILAVVLLACAVTPACAQKKIDYPTDGNGLLDYCSVLVDSVDSPSSLTSLSSDRFNEQMMKFPWCAGYLQATQDRLEITQISIALTSMLGVTLSGPDKEKAAAFELLRGACIPEKAPILQLARVLVKWLREHPEELHKPKGVLMDQALKDSFPCAPPTQKEEVKPAVKP